MTTRRVFLTATAAMGLGFGSSRYALATGPTGGFSVQKTADEWRKLLSPEAFNVLRKHGTERPFTSPLDKLVAKGRYDCAGCDLPLFVSDTKYDSGTGWPSFFKPIEAAVGTTSDWKLLYSRTEVHCSRCGGHLGHVFDDGPKPTGKRYCMNGVAMKFVPETQG